MTTTNATAPLDLDTIKPWLDTCPACDAGLPASCTCPPGDYRSPMLELVREVERLRATVEEFRQAHGNATYLADNLAATKVERDEFEAERDAARAELQRMRDTAERFADNGVAKRIAGIMFEAEPIAGCAFCGESGTCLRHMAEAVVDAIREEQLVVLTAEAADQIIEAAKARERAGRDERLSRISGWHARETAPGGMVGDYCIECGHRWPCDTRKMADGTYVDED